VHIVHSLGMCFVSILRMIRSFYFVHVHCRGPSPQSVTLCFTESGLLHLGHAFVDTRCISARRSWFGRMSFMAAYHVDWVRLDISLVWRLRHMRFQSTAGYFLIIRISQSGFSFMVSCRRVAQMRCLKVWRLSVGAGGGL
jgi:hypothetical protein